MEIDEILDAIEDYKNSKAEYVRCVESCESDASYFCYDQGKQLDRSKADLDGCLRRYVLSVIEDVLIPDGIKPKGIFS